MYMGKIGQKSAAFINHKPFHVGSFRNLERVWMVENQHAAAQRRQQELHEQRQQESNIEELRRAHYAGDRASNQGTQWVSENTTLGDDIPAHIARQITDAKLDWMYHRSPLQQQAADQEKYLLGEKAAPAAHDEDVKRVKELKQGGAPGSLMLGRAGAIGNEDILRKMREDPMFAIRQAEAQHKRTIQSNPILRAQEMLEQEEREAAHLARIEKLEKKLERHRDKERRRKHKSHRSHSGGEDEYTVKRSRRSHRASDEKEEVDLRKRKRRHEDEDNLRRRTRRRLENLDSPSSDSDRDERDKGKRERHRSHRMRADSHEEQLTTEDDGRHSRDVPQRRLRSQYSDSSEDESRRRERSSAYSRDRHSSRSFRREGTKNDRSPSPSPQHDRRAPSERKREDRDGHRHRMRRDLSDSEVEEERMRGRGRRNRTKGEEVESKAIPQQEDGVAECAGGRKKPQGPQIPDAMAQNLREARQKREEEELGPPPGMIESLAARRARAQEASLNPPPPPRAVAAGSSSVVKEESVIAGGASTTTTPTTTTIQEMQAQAQMLSEARKACVQRVNAMEAAISSHEARKAANVGELGPKLS